MIRKLSIEDCKDIYKRYQSGETRYSISKDYNVAFNSIKYVINARIPGFIRNNKKWNEGN